jgi:transcriptional regulator GlxA family with amidase domain
MNFAFLGFNDLEELDLVGPWEILAGGLKREKLIDNAFIVSEDGEPFRCNHGLEIIPHHSFENCPDFDYLLIPGGWGTRRETENPNLIQFITQRAETCRAVLSVCTGAFLLAEAGLLKGRQASTHWGSLDRLRAVGDIEVVEKRFVKDGKFWSSAGVSAGIDLSLAFLKEEFGEETAEAIQFYAEYYPSRIIYGSPEKHDEAPGYLKTP